MILKTKTIEVFDIQFDDQMWVLSIIKDEDSQEEFYEIVDSTGEKVSYSLFGTINIVKILHIYGVDQILLGLLLL